MTLTKEKNPHKLCITVISQPARNRFVCCAIVIDGNSLDMNVPTSCEQHGSFY